MQYDVSEDLEPTLIREAAAAFPVQSAQSDGLHPKHFRYFPEEALQALAKLGRLVQAFGDFPPGQRLAPTKLIPKPGGVGLRNIAVF